MATAEPTIKAFTAVPVMPMPDGLLMVRPLIALPFASVTAAPPELPISGFAVAATSALPFTTRATPCPASVWFAFSTTPLFRLAVVPVPS